MQRIGAEGAEYRRCAGLDGCVLSDACDFGRIGGTLCMLERLCRSCRASLPLEGRRFLDVFELRRPQSVKTMDELLKQRWFEATFALAWGA